MSTPDHQPMVPKSTYRLWGELTWDLWKTGCPRTHPVFVARTKLIRNSIEVANAAIERMVKDGR